MPGVIAVIFLCLVAFALSLDAVSGYGAGNALGIGSGAVAIVAMSLCLVLASRPRFLEPVFGGLDYMYRVHKWLGISALGFMFLHNQLEPDFERWVHETALGDFAGEMGEFAFNALIVLILFSWIKRIPVLGWEIPYQLWHFTHRFIGVLFVLAALHQLLVDKPFGLAEPLSIYLDTFCILGIAGYVYTEFFARKRRRLTCRVEALNRHPGAVEVVLAPPSQPVNWQPGQFMFLNIPNGWLSEAHPFTVVSTPRDGNRLRFFIKPLGDWTRRLPDILAPGSALEIEGPYGRFDFQESRADQLWIAGGIGITPFLAWVQGLNADETRRIHLVYSVRHDRDAVGLDMLETVAKNVPAFSFTLLVTGREGRMTAERIAAAVPFNIAGADMFFCGPSALRQSILKGLAEQDMRPRTVSYEYFDFR